MNMDYDDFVTDDELVALAVDVGRAWPAPLPTVAVEDASALVASAERGVRSLLVRGGLRGDELDLRLQAVAAAAGSRTVIVGYLADDAGRPLADAAAYAAIGTDDGWLRDEILPMGLHQFARFEDTAAVAAYFSSITTTVHEHGLADEYGEGAAFCVSSPTAVGARALAVARGSVVEQTIDMSGAVVANRPVSGDVRAAVTALVDAAASAGEKQA
jgi:hypothetical protein